MRTQGALGVCRRPWGSAEGPGGLRRALGVCRRPWGSAAGPGGLQKALGVCGGPWGSAAGPDSPVSRLEGPQTDRRLVDRLSVIQTDLGGLGRS